MSLHGMWEVAGAIGAAAAGALTWLWKRGTLKDWRKKRADGGHDLNGDVHEIKETLDNVQATTERALDVALDTQEDVERVEGKVDAVGETVYRLHEDDPAVSNEDALRNVLDVQNLEDDFLRGGEGGGG